MCLLHKSLYGIKQSPRCWFHRLSKFLITLEFKESIVDPSLFIFRNGARTVYLFVYVNDIVIVGSRNVKKILGSTNRLVTLMVRSIVSVTLFP